MPVEERGKRANLVQKPPKDEVDTHINENGVRQPNPPRVNILKIVNHIGANRETPQIPNRHTPQGTLQAPSSGQSGHRS